MVHMCFLLEYVQIIKHIKYTRRGNNSHNMTRLCRAVLRQGGNHCRHLTSDLWLYSWPPHIHGVKVTLSVCARAYIWWWHHLWRHWATFGEIDGTEIEIPRWSLSFLEIRVWTNYHIILRQRWCYQSIKSQQMYWNWICQKIKITLITLIECVNLITYSYRSVLAVCR